MKARSGPMVFCLVAKQLRHTAPFEFSQWALPLFICTCLAYMVLVRVISQYISVMMWKD